MTIDIDKIAEGTKVIGKEVYDDLGRPVAKPVGETLGLLPRAIKAALAPVEKWILQREYNLEETKKLLELKLEKISPDQIESPEPHIAVPALQYISYCMDNEELRNMYANLLANSMNSIVKNGVHPGFVEIIKQLSPDEAKLLKYVKTKPTVPTITLRYEKNDGSGIDIIKNFSDIGEKTNCEDPLAISKYFDNLNRLGLIGKGKPLASLSNKTLYEPLKNHPHILAMNSDMLLKVYGFEKINFEESYLTLTDYGKQFCAICID